MSGKANAPARQEVQTNLLDYAVGRRTYAAFFADPAASYVDGAYPDHTETHVATFDKGYLALEIQTETPYEGRFIETAVYRFLTPIRSQTKVPLRVANTYAIRSLILDNREPDTVPIAADHYRYVPNSGKKNRSVELADYFDENATNDRLFYDLEWSPASEDLIQWFGSLVCQLQGSHSDKLPNPALLAKA